MYSWKRGKMIQMTDHLFNSDILNKIIIEHKLLADTANQLEGFCSYVYSVCDSEENKYILKISHSSRISKESLSSELDFTKHLSNLGINICKPSTEPQNIEETSDNKGGYFFSYLYQWLFSFQGGKQCAPTKLVK